MGVAESMEMDATRMANKHIAGLECLLGGPTVSTVINDMDQLRIIGKETRQFSEQVFKKLHQQPTLYIEFAIIIKIE